MKESQSLTCLISFASPRRHLTEENLWKSRDVNPNKGKVAKNMRNTCTHELSDFFLYKIKKLSINIIIYILTL